MNFPTETGVCRLKITCWISNQHCDCRS